MSKELIVSAGRHETRVAILEDDQVVELFHEREKEYSLAGSIHKGRVTRVLPGMQSAFVDIGLDRDAFLYVSDFFEDNEEYDAVVSTVEDQVLKLEKGERSERPERGGRPDRGGDRGGDRGERGERPERSERAERPERGERPAVDEVAAVSDEVAAAAEGLIAGTMETPVAEASVTEAAPVVEHREGRPERQGERGGGDRRPDAGGDRGGDRGGRGRRGRRRRGGRGNSGLPESKFFTPRQGGGEARHSEQPQAEVAAAPVEEAPHERVRAVDDDFMVLPGESLAKYSPSDEREELNDPAEEDFGDDMGGLEEEQSAAGLNAETEEKTESPMAAEVIAPAEFGVVASWVAQKRAADAARKPEEMPSDAELPSASRAEPEESSGEEAPVAAAPFGDEGGEEEALIQSDEDEGISGGEVAEIELAEEVFEAQEEDGPEPARIPTSLTATLREQGHRYPHRVSRRMRRKMRGGAPGEEGTKPATGVEETSPAENKTVTLPEERRPDRNERDRGPRSDRDRGERTGERPERSGERPERTERPERNGERTERSGDRSGRERPERERPPLPSISDLLKEGQEIIVQIAKEPLGQKGARITSHIALPGRFVVYMPTVEHVGVSRKIPSDEERQRLKRVLQTHRQGIPGGFICRTAAENKSEEELRVDMHFLYNLWLDMRQKAEKKPAPLLLHHDLDLVQRILRDQLTTSFKTIWVDNEEYYESILRFVERFQPALIGRVKLYTRSNPIFDEFGITNEVEKALRPKVWLKSGGYIVINQTEALVAIDINTGKYVGKSNRLEDTIVKVNTDAIKEIVRQIRLRDLGGIIVVDFIDMDERKNRQKVMGALEDAMRVDRAPYKILQFNDFGLVAITRKRVKQSLERTLCAPCPYCEAAGYVKSVQTVIGEILTEAQRMRKALETEPGNLMLRVNPEVAKVLKSNHNSFMQEIEEILGKTVLVKSDPLLHQTKFDLA